MLNVSFLKKSVGEGAIQHLIYLITMSFGVDQWVKYRVEGAEQFNSFK